MTLEYLACRDMNVRYVTGLFEPLGAIVAGLFLHAFITEERYVTASNE